VGVVFCFFLPPTCRLSRRLGSKIEKTTLPRRITDNKKNPPGAHPPLFVLLRGNGGGGGKTKTSRPPAVGPLIAGAVVYSVLPPNIVFSRKVHSTPVPPFGAFPRQRQHTLPPRNPFFLPLFFSPPPTNFPHRPTLSFLSSLKPPPFSLGGHFFFHLRCRSRIVMRFSSPQNKYYRVSRAHSSATFLNITHLSLRSALIVKH